MDTTQDDRSPQTPLSPREQIAHATAELVSERGLEGATMRRVADRLSCTTGFISHYFTAKDDLLEAALRATVDGLVRAASTGPAPRTVEQWADRVAASLTLDEQSTRFWRVLVAFQAASLTSERLGRVLTTYAEEQKPYLFRLLRTQLTPGVPDDAVHELTDAVWVLTDGLGTTAALNPLSVPPAVVRTALTGAVHALVADLQEKYP